MATFIPLDNIITQIVDSSGDPAASFTLESFIAGTSTPTNLFTTNAGGGGATSFTFDSSGYISASGSPVGLFRDNSIDLKLVLKNASASTVWTFDNIDNFIFETLKTTQSGTEALPAIIIGDGTSQDINTGWFHSDTDEWSFSANATTVLTISTLAFTLKDITLFIQERTSAQADVAGFGQYWVLTATPNEPWFTDDAGNDSRLATIGQAFIIGLFHL